MMAIVKMLKLSKLAQWSTSNAWQVRKPEIPTKGRKKLSCHHERQIREDKSADLKAKPYQWLFYVRIRFAW